MDPKRYNRNNLIRLSSKTTAIRTDGTFCLEIMVTVLDDTNFDISLASGSLDIPEKWLYKFLFMMVTESCPSNPRELFCLYTSFRSILTLDVQNNWHLKNAAIRFVAQGCTRALHFTDSQRHSEDFKKFRRMETSPDIPMPHILR